MGCPPQGEGRQVVEGRPITTHNNHYVPQATLRRWAGPDRKISTHALLVPSDSVRPWIRRSPKVIGSRLGFYSRHSSSAELDEFETWLTRTYEEPGQDAIEKLLRNDRMQPADWDRVSMFVAVQQRRTPVAFIEFAERWPKVASESLEHSVRQLKRRLVESRQTDIPIKHTPKEDHLTGTVRVVKHIDTETDQAALGLEIASMRSVWMADFKRLLRDNAKIITSTRWQTVVPAGGEQWVLTDHPTLNIIYKGPGKYEFKAGWGQSKANFFMPLSPRLALFTEIGQRKTGRFDATPDLTQLFQRMQVERAFRSVFAVGEPAWVERVRPRTVDLKWAMQEQKMWERWDPEQASAEAEFEARDSTPPAGAALED